MLSLGAFVYGYVLVDEAVETYKKVLLSRFPGPSGADVFTRAYLFHGEKGYPLILDELMKVVRSSPTQAEVRGFLYDKSFIDFIRKPILTRRYGMALGENSIVWLANAFSGYLSAGGSVGSGYALLERTRLMRFERWLWVRCGYEDVAWYRLIRVFEGPGERGLTRFLELWDEHAQADSNGV